MKILFINTSRIWGGNEKWTRLAAGQLSLKHDVFLAYRSEKLGLRFAVNKKRFFFLNRLDIFSLLSLINYIRKNNFQVVVSTNRKFYLLGGLASRMTNCRHFVRCGIVWKVPDNLYYRVLFTRLIDGVIVNAKTVKDTLTQTAFINKDLIHLIYNGLDLDRLEEAQATRTEKPFAFTLITSGQLTPRKGHKLLISAFARFLKKYRVTDAGLVLMGSGRQKEELASLAADLGIGSKILFTGFLDNPYPLLARADLYITLSENEGISNSLLEAMFLKVPVISSLAGGAGEFIRNGFNGLLVRDYSQETLADLLHQVYQGDRYANMAEAGRQTVLERFSLDTMAKSLEKVFKADRDG